MFPQEKNREGSISRKKQPTLGKPHMNQSTGKPKTWKQAQSWLCCWSPCTRHWGLQSSALGKGMPRAIDEYQSSSPRYYSLGFLFLPRIVFQEYTFLKCNYTIICIQKNTTYHLYFKNTSDKFTFKKRYNHIRNTYFALSITSIYFFHISLKLHLTPPVLGLILSHF